MNVMPRWVDAVLIPLISIILAFAISALVILAIGEDPIKAIRIMVEGTFGNSTGVGYMLYYATNFMFTGLAVAIAFHARLFNIGGEGQAAARAFAARALRGGRRTALWPFQIQG